MGEHCFHFLIPLAAVHYVNRFVGCVVQYCHLSTEKAMQLHAFVPTSLMLPSRLLMIFSTADTQQSFS